MHQRNRLLASVTLETGVQVGPAGGLELRGVENARLDSFFLENVLEKERRLKLVSRWIRRVHADVVREHTHGLVSQRVPIHGRAALGVRRGRGDGAGDRAGDQGSCGETMHW